MASNTPAEATLKFVLDIVSEGVWDWDATTGRVERSPGWYRMLDYPEDYFKKDVLTWENVIHPEDYPRVMAHFEDYIEGRAPEYRIRYRCMKANGDPLWIEDSAKIFARKEDGSVARMVGAHTNIHALVAAEQMLEEQAQLLNGGDDAFEQLIKQRTDQIASLNRKLAEKIKQIEHVATHDSLTGIYNRGMFQELLDIEIKRAKRYGYPMSVILADVDHFKSINDQHGHATGDKVLKDIATHLGNHIREGDALARWGGEEFAIILPNTPTDKGMEMAERLRHEIEISPATDGIQVTCSFGVTTFDRKDTAEALFARMDKALYKAKNQNRNNVQLL